MYAAEPTVVEVSPGHWYVDIDETEVGVDDYVVVKGLPAIGSVMRVESSIVSGTATTVAPVASTSTTFEGRDVIVQATAAAAVDEFQVEGVPFALVGGVLNHRSTPDAGSDNVIRTRYLIRAAWSL